MKKPLCLSLALCAAFQLHAQEPKPKIPTYLTAEDARAEGADVDLQGEYAGDKLGAQVIALGNATFRLVLLEGGLPGAGWDGGTKLETEGRLDSGGVAFEKDGCRAALTKDGLSGERGGAKFALKRIVRESPTLGARPPAGAVVLFDGKNCDAFVNGHFDDLNRNLLASGSKTKQDDFQSYHLHVEFILPFKPLGRGQDRANSGVYMQDRYEVQVLDSFGLKGLNNECGGIYSKRAPSVNMCLPPLVWQTYDIDFEAAKHDAQGMKTRNAVITVKHNGVVIHDNVEIDGPTGGGKKEGPAGGAIQLQGHGNPVCYRNIWLVPKP
jgi:hypothetical protein